MRKPTLWVGILLLLGWLTLSTFAQQPCASGWLPGYGESTLKGNVLCVQPFDFDGAGPEPVQYVMAGGLSRGIDIAVQNIVAWDGQRTSSLAEGFNNVVLALTVHNGQLIAAGYFTHSGSTVVNGIAAWNGLSWQPFGSGLISPGQAVHAVVSHQGMLYAAGNFSGRLRRWNGATWSDVTGWNTSHQPALLRSYEDNLYVMGPFNRLGTGILRFDGTNWTTIPGLAGSGIATNEKYLIWSMEVINDDLYVIWPIGGSVRTKRLHRWDGSTLETLPLVRGPNDAFSVVGVHEGSVIVAGNFPAPAGHRDLFATFDSGSWTPFGAVLSPSLPRWLAPIYSRLFVGRDVDWGYIDPSRSFVFSNVLHWPHWQPVTRLGYHNGQVLANRGLVTQEAEIGPLAAWNGTNLSRIRAGDLPDLQPLNLWDEDGDLLIDGYSALLAGRVLARLSGSVWTVEFPPFPPGANFASPFRLANARWNGASVIGFQFLDSSTAPAARKSRVLIRQSGDWLPLGPDLLGTIQSLAVRSDGLYAAGAITGVDGGGALSRVARWDGTTWQPVGHGLAGDCDDMVSFNDDLLVVGAFTESGGTVVNYAAAWNGQSWRGLANGLPGRASRIVVVNQQPWAACVVSGRGRLYRWDGDNWNLMFEVQDGVVHDFVEHGGEIVVVGDLLLPGGPSGPVSARWARYSFNDAPVITSRLQNAVVCSDNSATISVSHSGVGPFTYQWRRDGVTIADGVLPDGTVVSGAATPMLLLTNIGAGSPLPFECTITNACGSDTAPVASVLRCLADFNCSRSVTVQDLLDFLAAYFAGGAAADFNLSGTVTVQDIFDYLATFFLGC